MQSFKNHVLEESVVDAAKKKLAKMKGQEVSFTHQTTGEKVTGTYNGMKSRDGRSYARVSTASGGYHVPPHHIHQAQ